MKLNAIMIKIKKNGFFEDEDETEEKSEKLFLKKILSYKIKKIPLKNGLVFFQIIL